jgi:hypothetical protein
MAPLPGRTAFVDLAYGSLSGSLYTSSGRRVGRSISLLCNLEILNAGKMLDDVLSRVVSHVEPLGEMRPGFHAHFTLR